MNEVNDKVETKENLLEKNEPQLEAQARQPRRIHNVFDEIQEMGHDEFFIPAVTDEFCPTDAPAGSPAKVQVLAERVRKGLPLWHPEDRMSYNGLVGTTGRARD